MLKGMLPPRLSLTILVLFLVVGCGEAVTPKPSIGYQPVIWAKVPLASFTSNQLNAGLNQAATATSQQVHVAMQWQQWADTLHTPSEEFGDSCKFFYLAQDGELSLQKCQVEDMLGVYFWRHRNRLPSEHLDTPFLLYVSPLYAADTLNAWTPGISSRPQIFPRDEGTFLFDSEIKAAVDAQDVSGTVLYQSYYQGLIKYATMHELGHQIGDLTHVDYGKGVSYFDDAGDQMTDNSLHQFADTTSGFCVMERTPRGDIFTGTSRHFCKPFGGSTNSASCYYQFRHKMGLD